MRGRCVNVRDWDSQGATHTDIIADAGVGSFPGVI